MRPLVLACAVAATLLAGSLSAQFRVQPVAEHPGEVALRLMLRRLATAGTFMETTAHPDDEDNGLLAMMGLGRGMRSVLVSATRGEGGQNEIGPELFEALSVLRTEELIAAHRFDGAEQYFTRAMDFGYSFSVDESLEKWGREEILGDLVRHIRGIRPDVIAAFLCDGAGGGQHHQAATLLTREAFDAAADPARFPEQIREGLRPWQAKRLFCTDMSSFAPAGAAAGPGQPLVRIQDAFDPLLGRSYGVLGIEARSMHKCQGTSQLLPLPGVSVSRTYRLQAGGSGSSPGPKDLFDGIDTSLGAIAAFAGPSPAGSLLDGLRRMTAAVEQARSALERQGQFAAVEALASGLAAARDLRARLGGLVTADAARFEIDFRLARKEQQFQEALVVAQGLRLEVLADDGLVTKGQPIGLSILASNDGPADVAVKGMSLAGFDGAAAPCPAAMERGQPFRCDASVRVGDVPLSTPYWRRRRDSARYDFEPGVPFGVPFRPSPFRATLALEIAGAPVTVDRVVEYRYDNVTAGEKRMELQVVPAMAISLAPDIAVIPGGASTDASAAAPPAVSRELAVTIINHERGPSTGEISLRVPSGWTASPARAHVSFTREDESATAKFSVRPPAGALAGEFTVTAQVNSSAGPAAPSLLGYEVIEYPHVRRRHLVKEARAALKIIDVTVPSGLTIGYVMGVGDQVPQAIEQLGAGLTLIGPDELASGDLSVYDVIVTGVRAYERRADLRANNHRLLAYAEEGGTVLVQYNKFEFNQAQYGPYPARVSSNRVTDEGAPVDVLVPGHPIFTTPNPIGPEAWAGWVQERGLYFLGERDPRYADLVRLADPFELNPGPKTGALVEARVGKGRWIYIGLGLWRQLPAGTPGAYRLLANLLSLGRPR